MLDGEHKTGLLFTPVIDRDIHALFLKQITDRHIILSS